MLLLTLILCISGTASALWFAGGPPRCGAGPPLRRGLGQFGQGLERFAGPLRRVLSRNLAVFSGLLFPKSAVPHLVVPKAPCSEPWLLAFNEGLTGAFQFTGQTVTCGAILLTKCLRSMACLPTKYETASAALSWVQRVKPRLALRRLQPLCV